MLILGIVFLSGLAFAGLWFKWIRYQLPRPLPAGQCTWYAEARAKEAGWTLEFRKQYGRDARKWGEMVSNGELSMTPTVGSLMLLDAWDTNPYGHVAYVEKVEWPDRIQISHMNMGMGEVVEHRDHYPVRRAKILIRDGEISFAEIGATYRLIGFLKKT